MENLSEHIRQVLHDGTYLCVIGNPRQKDEKLQKIEIHRIDGRYYVEKFTKTQAFHSQLSHEEVCDYIAECLSAAYRDFHAWDDAHEYGIRISKKGKALFTKTPAPASAPRPRAAHNQEKTALIPAGTYIAPLYDMGIYTKDGAIVSGMHNKFRQINRFVETIDDALRRYDRKELNILDFGCGKSYLTFVLYYYLTEIRGLQVNMTGLDLKADVVDKCNASARKYGYKTLSFQVGDIARYRYDGPLDMVVTLHACDTATDYALYNAIQWKAKMIFSVPCCQHELNEQIEPKRLVILSRYGLIKERFCAMATDALRANLLTSRGYKTQLLEFVDFEHTPKNIMIRAIYTGAENKAEALGEAIALMEEFGFQPMLYRLLAQEGNISPL